jgi:hypothetical protein
MTTEMSALRRDMAELRSAVERLAALVDEPYPLAAGARRSLARARREPLASYVEHDEVTRRYQ